MKQQKLHIYLCLNILLLRLLRLLEHIEINLILGKNNIYLKRNCGFIFS